MTINESAHPEDFLIGQITQEIVFAMQRINPSGTLELIRVALVEYYIDRITRVPESLIEYVMYDLKKIMVDADKPLLQKALSSQLQQIIGETK